jgi:hypothetical protein
MSRASEKLASLQYTTWNLVILLLWLSWGMLMAASDAYVRGFQGMNSVLIRDWFGSQQAGFHILKIWFVGLCLLMTSLCINLIFCSWEKIFKIIRSRFNRPKIFMLIIHAIFGFVALGHLGGLMSGYKYNNIKLGEGSAYSFEDGYRIEVKRVNYISDYKVLDKTKYITRDEFDYKKNSAEILLSRNGKELKRGNVCILSPICYRDIQVTLRNFMKSPDSGVMQDAGESKPWIIVTVSRNPVLKIYLFLYPVMIAGIFIYLILTWQVSGKNNAGALSS